MSAEARQGDWETRGQGDAVIRRFSLFPCLLVALSLLLLAAATARAEDVLQQVPRDALGFLVVRNLDSADAKATRLFKALRARLPGPLAMLRTTAGVHAGRVGGTFGDGVRAPPPLVRVRVLMKNGETRQDQSTADGGLLRRAPNGRLG